MSPFVLSADFPPRPQLAAAERPMALAAASFSLRRAAKPASTSAATSPNRRKPVSSNLITSCIAKSSVSDPKIITTGFGDGKILVAKEAND